jgi:hypothetical protein
LAICISENNAHYQQGVFFAKLFLGGDDAVAVLFGVSELQRIGGLHAGPQLARAALVQQRVESRACLDVMVMVAFRADHQIAIKLGAIQHGAAAGALFPHALRHRTLPAVGALRPGTRVHDFLQPVHSITSKRF